MWDIAHNLLVVAGQVVTLFLMIGVGYVMARQGHLSQQTLGQMSHLLLYAVLPCLLISSIQIQPSPLLLRNMGLILAVTAGYYVVFCGLLPLVFRRSPEDTRATLRFGTVYANTGFMGMPLIQAVLGDEAVILAVMANVTYNLAQWTHGVALMGGRDRMSLRQAVLNPGTVSLFIGMVIFFSGFRLPTVVETAVEYIGDLNTPLAMVVIGGQMASTNLADTFRRKELYAASGLKLVVIPAITALALLPLRLPSLVYSAAVILSATPAAGSTSILAQQFHRDPGTAAQLVSLSTLLSVLTLPVAAVASSLLA